MMRTHLIPVAVRDDAGRAHVLGHTADAWESRANEGMAGLRELKRRSVALTEASAEKLGRLSKAAAIRDLSRPVRSTGGA